jgi:hypothetical protein
MKTFAKDLFFFFAIICAIAYMVGLFYEANPDFSTWDKSTRQAIAITVSVATGFGVIGCVMKQEIR